jgi:hypothetical protein
VAVIKTVGVKDLKNGLSAYLREVRHGARVLVADRGTVVAELREPDGVFVATIDPSLAAWVESGVLTLPSCKKSPLPRSPLRLAEGTAQGLLVDLRSEER